MLADQSGQKPKLLLQRVPEAKTSKNRMHLDIETAADDDEVTRLEDPARDGLRPKPAPNMAPGG
jgi:hypothetical protein